MLDRRDFLKLEHFLAENIRREKTIKSLCDDLGTCRVPFSILVVLYNSDGFSMPLRVLKNKLAMDASNLRAEALELEKKGFILISHKGKFCILTLSAEGRSKLENLDNMAFLNYGIHY